MQCAKHQRGEARMHRKWRMTMHRLGNPCTRSASIRKYLKIQSNRSFVFATRISSSLCKNVTKTPLYMFFQTFTRLIRNQYVKEQGSMLYCRYRTILRNIYSSISYYFIWQLKFEASRGLFLYDICVRAEMMREPRDFSVKDFLVSFELNGKRNAVEKVRDKQYRRGDIGEPGREPSRKGYLLLGYWTTNWGDERGCTFDGLAIISWLRFAFVSRSSWIQCEDSLPWKSALMFIFVQPRSL